MFVTCTIVNMLGNIKPHNVVDRVFRDLMADIFDSLYDSRRLMLESKLQRAYPILRRAYESLSLLALILNDSSYAEKWEAGRRIYNAEIRRELAKHPLGETEESLRELYNYYCLATHPNRELVPYRFLGEGNKFVLGSVDMPDLVMLTHYAIKHLSMWYWFDAVITFKYKELLADYDPAYVDNYKKIKKEAQEVAEWLTDNLKRLIVKNKESTTHPAS
jgi:hypothetical protein